MSRQHYTAAALWRMYVQGWEDGTAAAREAMASKLDELEKRYAYAAQESISALTSRSDPDEVPLSYSERRG